MYEVEVKVRTAHEPVRDALETAGATYQGSLEQRDQYFEAPHRDFAARDEALRIREQEAADRTETKLTYKGPRLEHITKTRTEHETTVGDAEAMTNALQALGFSPAATVEKRREVYEFDSATVTLDTVAGLGEFVEVEVTAEEAALDRTRNQVIDTLAELGLEQAERLQTSYLELLLD